MKTLATFTFCLAAVSASAAGSDDFLDRVDQALTLSAQHDTVRARLSGTIDLEGYAFDAPAPAFLYSEREELFNPRLALFLDGQIGSHTYVFAQARVDQGFDPGDRSLRSRVDEYAVRFTPWANGVFNLQIGKFATVVGNWVPRHHSWTNPFVSAPLPYENLVGVFDVSAPGSPAGLLGWAQIGPGPFPTHAYLAQSRVPILWGPSYASGAAISGVVDGFDYAFEIKNASLSSRPGDWDASQRQWQNPTYSGRIGFRPNKAWNLGLSASTGSYLRAAARPTLASGYSLSDYRQVVIGQDLGYAWHHFELWAEFFETYFDIPHLGRAETFAYYVEARYKFTPQFFGALRWNEQLFGTIPDGKGGTARWGRDTWRIDFAPTYRFTSHLQLKLQYSLQHAPMGSRKYSTVVSTQLVLRF
jgi:hypothetical protein